MLRLPGNWALCPGRREQVLLPRRIFGETNDMCATQFGDQAPIGQKENIEGEEKGRLTMCPKKTKVRD